MDVVQEQRFTWNGSTPRCGCGAVRKQWRSYCDRCTRARRKPHCEKTDEQKAKANARSYLNQYIRRGKIERGPCVDCGSIVDVEGHHADYSKPLEVTWHCRPCHLAKHGVTVSRRPKTSAADGEAGKPSALFAFYDSLHARGEGTESIAQKVGRSRAVVTRVFIGARRRGPVWTKLAAILTPDEIALLDTVAESDWAKKRALARPVWTPEKAAVLAAPS